LDSSVSTATGYGLDGRVRFAVGTRYFSLLHSVKNGSGTHPPSYAMGTGGPFTVGKVAGA
jgi:hypothetical protein